MALKGRRGANAGEGESAQGEAGARRREGRPLPRTETGVPRWATGPGRGAVPWGAVGKVMGGAGGPGLQEELRFATLGEQGGYMMRICLDHTALSDVTRLKWFVQGETCRVASGRELRAWEEQPCRCELGGGWRT